MGTTWLERNLAVFINKVLGLVANNKTTPNHVEAVYARKCVNFILRTVISFLLSDGGQMLAGKELCEIIRHTMSNMKINQKPGFVPESLSDDGNKIYLNSSGDNSHHVLVCALQELSCLVQGLNTKAGRTVKTLSCYELNHVLIKHNSIFTYKYCFNSIAKCRNCKIFQ